MGKCSRLLSFLTFLSSSLINKAIRWKILDTCYLLFALVGLDLADSMGGFGLPNSHKALT